MTCEPHVRRELEAEAAAERAAVAAGYLAETAEAIEPSAEWPPAPTVPNSPYPDPAPVVDADTATVTARVR